jgi:hypothetical protein
MVNPTTKIIATAEELAETQMLYAAGADYVTIARIDQANELIDAVTAAEAVCSTNSEPSSTRNCATGGRFCHNTSHFRPPAADFKDSHLKNIIGPRGEHHSR